MLGVRGCGLALYLGQLLPHPWHWLFHFLLIVPSCPLPPSHSAQPACSGDLLLQNKPPQNLVAEMERVSDLGRALQDLSAPPSSAAAAQCGWRVRFHSDSRTWLVSCCWLLARSSAGATGVLVRALWFFSTWAPRWLCGLVRTVEPLLSHQSAELPS